MNRWQLYSINSTTYVLRSEEGGPTAFLSSKYARNETTPGQTAALMLRGDLTDDSVYWSVTPWGDGTFFMTNGANGTAWHLQKKGNGWVALNSNTTDTPPGQRWSFTAIHDGDKAAKINDKNYSTVDVSMPLVKRFSYLWKTNHPSATKCDRDRTSDRIRNLRLGDRGPQRLLELRRSLDRRQSWHRRRCRRSSAHRANSLRTVLLATTEAATAILKSIRGAGRTA